MIHCDSSEMPISKCVFSGNSIVNTRRLQLSNAKGIIMSKITMLIVSALLAMSLLAPTPSSATPTDQATTWSFGGLFVGSYTVIQNGDLGVTFKNSAGTLFTTWNNQNGVNQCPGQSTLQVAAGYPPIAKLERLLLEAAIARKPLHVWFEATGGICYIKALNATI
jgi:hypothetical protein